MITLKLDYSKLGKKGAIEIEGAISGYQEITSYGPFVGATVPAITSATYDLDITVDGDAMDQLAVALLDTDDWDGIAAKMETALQSATSGSETVAIVDNKMKFTSALTGVKSKISLATGTTGSGGGDLVAAITAISGYTASYGLAVDGTGGDLDSVGYQTISNTGSLGVFANATVCGLTNATYDLDVDEDGNGNNALAIALLAADTWDGVCVKIETALQSATSGSETVAVVDGKIKITSATDGATSTIVIVAGTTGSGGGDLIAAITALGATYTAVIDTASDGSEGTVSVDVGKPTGSHTSMWTMVEVKSTAGLQKSGYVIAYSPSTGMLSISDDGTTTELVAGDVISFVATQY